MSAIDYRKELAVLLAALGDLALAVAKNLYQPPNAEAPQPITTPTLNEVRTNVIKYFMYPDGRVDSTNASVYLGLSPGTLARHRTEGTGPKFIRRGRIYYYKADLDDWIQKGRVPTTAQAELPKK